METERQAVDGQADVWTGRTDARWALTRARGRAKSGPEPVEY